MLTLFAILFGSVVLLLVGVWLLLACVDRNPHGRPDDSAKWKEGYDD